MKKYNRLLAMLLAMVLLFTVDPLFAVADTIDEPAETKQLEELNEFDEEKSAVLPESSDPYDGFIGTVGSTEKNTYNVFVGVERGMTIKSFNGTDYAQGSLDTEKLNQSFATLEEITYGTDLAGVKVRGLTEGVTSFKIGSDTYTLYVVPGISSYAQNSKTIEISVKEITDCKSYFSVNAGNLQKIESTGYLINQTFVGGFQISFFTAPEEGYALTKMYITGTSGQYYSLGDGTRADGSDSEAWPLNNPDAADKNDAQGWKKDRQGYDHGYKTPLTTSDFMSVDRLRGVYTAAIGLECDGTAQFGNYGDGSNRTAEITFAAEKLPTMVKSISRYKSSKSTEDWENYDPDCPPELRLGDQLEYTFTIQRSGTKNVKYSDILLSDDKIGYQLLLTYQDGQLLGYVGDEEKDTPDYTFGSGSSDLTITTAYTINSDDVSKYSGGDFVNSATLSYQYHSTYSAGLYKVSQSSSVSCKIYGMAVYQWNDDVPDDIKTEFTCPKAHEFVANENATIQGENLQGKSKVICNNGTWQKWTFTGWKIAGDTSETIYTPGDTLNTAAITGQKNVTLLGCWESENLSPNSVTYQWSGLPEGTTSPTCPVEQLYYETQTYSPDQTYQQGTWTKTGSLKITVSGSDAIDENQTFLFHVTGENVDLTVTVHGNTSVTISGLALNQAYHVKQLTDWSWRYKCTGDQATQTITLTDTNNSLIFAQTRSQSKWLDGNTFWNDLMNGLQEGN